MTRKAMFIFALVVLACRTEEPVRMAEPSGAGAGSLAPVAPESDASKSELEPAADSELTAALLEEPPIDDAAVPPVVWPRGNDARKPIENDRATEAHAHAASRLLPLRRQTGLGPLRPRGRGARGRGELGAFTPVEDPPSGSALAGFYRDLGALRAGRKDKVRIVMYGASGVSADVATAYVRSYMQARFGDGGPGFVPFVPLTPWYRHNEVEVSASPGWEDEHVQKSGARADGNFGLLGASFSSKRAGAWAEIRPNERSISAQHVANIELFFLAQPEGGNFEVFIDDVAREVVETAAHEARAGYRTYALEPGPHRVKIVHRGGGEVRLFGAVLERREPGVVLDTLGIGGTRASNQLAWNEEVWGDNIERRAPSLFTLDFGTNESMDTDQPISVYRGKLRQVLGRYREHFPEASCVLVMPHDFPVMQGRTVKPRPRLLEIIEVQREVAPEFGCGVWDTLAFMGGPGSMAQWVRSRPAMARNDYIHLNLRGQTRQGQALSDALMWSFDALQSMAVQPVAVSAGAPGSSGP